MKSWLLQLASFLIIGYFAINQINITIAKHFPIKQELTLIPMGLMNITAYQPKRKQTDSSPFSTSIGERVTIRGCAVSQEMLSQNGGPIHYGDLLYIEHIGFRFVNDCMNRRIQHGLDLWVPDQSAERQVFLKFHNGLTNVYLVIPANS